MKRLALIAALLVSAFAADMAAAQTSKDAQTAPNCTIYAKPEGCIEPPLRSEIKIFGSLLPGEAGEPTDDRLIRDAWVLRNTDPPGAEFPVSLMAEQKENNSQFQLVVTIDGADRITDCAIVSAGYWVSGVRESDPGDRPLDQLACDYATRYGKVRHAIDRDGSAVPTKAGMTVEFSRRRYERVPAPMLVTHSASNDQPDGDWLPRWFRSTDVTVTPPRWKDFLSDRKRLPVSAAVGVLVNIAKDGTAASCIVKSSSGDTRLDQASCAGLIAQHFTGKRYAAEDFPVFVRWHKAEGSIEMPREAVTPAMIGGAVSFPGTALPPGLAEYHAVTVKLAVSALGELTSCEIYGSSLNDQWDARSCQLARQLVRLSPGRDLFGKTVSGTARLVVDWDNKTIKAPAY